MLPRLQAYTGMRGVPTASAFRIFQWAQAVVERCAFRAPYGRVAIAPYISALPQVRNACTLCSWRAWSMPVLSCPSMLAAHAVRLSHRLGQQGQAWGLVTCFLL